MTLLDFIHHDRACRKINEEEWYPCYGAGETAQERERENTPKPSSPFHYRTDSSVHPSVRPAHIGTKGTLRRCRRQHLSPSPHSARENEKLSARESQPVPNLLCGGAFEMLVFTVVYDRKQPVCRAASALCTCSSGVTMRLDLLLKGSAAKGRSRGGEARCGMERRASEWERGRQSERRDYDGWPVNFGYVTPMGETLTLEQRGERRGELRDGLEVGKVDRGAHSQHHDLQPRNIIMLGMSVATLSKDARERMLEVRGVVVDVQGQRWSGGRDRMEGLSGCCGGGLEMNGSRGTHQSGGDADGPGARNTVGDAHALGTANGESEPALSARGKKSPIRRAQKTIEAGSLIKADWLNAHSGDPGLGSGMMA
ncbi:hypothetical protein DFP72DRAFT_860457 [Ephemerocybe angulata]|uniref:Uncharacterized protein n=1 Tax=Ephemerocybe angulata TaxID=980116 RepID=A0A8H6LSS8_9AGAR|nr:hypothetical protein DFP72DRAFT_860457 [Tulosesus angulatus]